MNYKKIADIIEMVDEYALPLAEQGVKMTKTPDDNLVVAFFSGGLPALQKKIEEVMPNEKKIASILNLVIQYIIPLAKEGVKITKTPDDDLAVSFIEGGLPAVQKKLLDLASQPVQPSPKPTVTTTNP